MTRFVELLILSAANLARQMPWRPVEEWVQFWATVDNVLMAHGFLPSWAYEQGADRRYLREQPEGWTHVTDAWRPMTLSPYALGFLRAHDTDSLDHVKDLWTKR